MRIPILAAVIVFVISLAFDIYIYLDLRRVSKKHRGCVFYIWTTVACMVLFGVVLFMPKKTEDNSIIPLMWMLYSYLSIYLSKAGYVLCSIIGRVICLFRKRNHKIVSLSRWTGVIMAFSIFFMMWWGVFYTRRHIEVVPVDVSSPQIPVSFDGYKVAQISDLHVGTWGKDTTFVAALVDTINSLKPDLIVFTGDIVNRDTDELRPFISVLSRLSAPDGVMSILGNHDYGDYVDWDSAGEKEENNMRLAQYQKVMGWDLLNNERRFVVHGQDSIMVIGIENIGDPPFAVYGDLEKSLPSCSDSIYHQNDHMFKILLSHNPAHWDEYVSHDTNIGLTLSGHTHAMQVKTDIFGWEWSPAQYRYKQWGGMYERLNDMGHNVRLYVNIGAGEVGFPARMLDAYPEVTLITLHHQGM